MPAPRFIQNLITELGQSQDERTPDELRPHFVDVEDRTPHDLLRFVQKFAKYVNYFKPGLETSSPPTWKAVRDGTWESFFRFDEREAHKLLEHAADRLPYRPETGSTPPHLALLVAFLRLYELPREVINRTTSRHLDFYYRRVLRFGNKPATPDRAHVLLELKKNAGAVRVLPTHQFSAGKDAGGAELVYAPLRETVIGTATVDSLSSVFVDHRGHGTVRFAPIANSSDGLGGELAGDAPKWRPFGYAALPPAEIGFAFASPVLRMREGERTVTVALKGSSELSNPRLGGALQAFITGDKGWLGPYLVTASVKGETTELAFTVPETSAAVVDYDIALHGYAYAATAPIVQLHLEPGNGAIGYDEVKNIFLGNARISVDVSKLATLDLENDGGTLNPKKSFLPFGPQPTEGATFRVGCAEAFAKKLSKLTLEIHWQGIPPDFAKNYFGNYGVGELAPSYFTAHVSFEDGGGWKYTKSRIELFDSLGGSKRTLAFDRSSPPPRTSPPAHVAVYGLLATGSTWAGRVAERHVLKRPVLQSAIHLASADAPEARQGFLTLSLEKSFLHAVYRQKTVEEMMAFAKAAADTALIVLNEPYTPAIQNIYVSYQAHTDEVPIDSDQLGDFAHPDLAFFHVGTFGQMREHGYQRAQFDFLSKDGVRLFPFYGDEGELLVGLRNLRPGDSVSVLFEVADGSADPDVAQQPLTWFVLCDNYWKRLAASDVVLDTTNQLLTSGTITFVIPREATSHNTMLPSDRIWLKASVAEHAESVSQLVRVAANAVEVQLVEGANDPSRLATPLEKGKIVKLKTPISSVKSVSQPYSSFGGRPAESDVARDTRASERLRHKQRCITAWDYERIVLERYPSVRKVKCVPHAKNGAWLSPGHVLLVVIPDLRNKNSQDPLEPKVDADTINRIQAYVQARAGMWTATAGGAPREIAVHVKNPAYQKIQLDFAVKFRRGFEFNLYSELLKGELIRFLSPWAYEPGRDLSFGGSMAKSVLLDFVDRRDYVDYVTNFKMSVSSPSTDGSREVDEARPETPDAILVSDPIHNVGEA